LNKSPLNYLPAFLRRDNVKQMLRYGLIGVVNVSTEYLVFNLAYYFGGHSAVVANTWAIAITMSSGFLFHHAFTFKNRFFSWRQAIRYICVVALGGALNYGILIGLMTFIPQVWLAKFIQIIILSLYNFNMYKHFVYVNKD